LQAGGYRFDPGYLHQMNLENIRGIFLRKVSRIDF
jgi:hypothetical protein